MRVHFGNWVKAMKVVLISASVLALILSSFVQAVLTDSHGDLTFKFFPDGDIEVEIDGEMHQIFGSSDIGSYLRGMSFSQFVVNEGVDLHRIHSDATISFAPELSFFLMGLELDIEAQMDNQDVEMSLLTSIPGVVSVDGDVSMIFEEGTSLGVLEAELSVTMWYTFFEREQIEAILQNITSMKVEFEVQVADRSEGRLEVDEFILDSEVGTLNSIVTLRAVISGDWGGGFMELANSVSSEYFDESYQDVEILPDVILILRSSEVHITFDSDELALYIEAEAIIEGDLDEQANLIKDEICEEILEKGDADADTREIIEEFVIPSELKVSNLNSSFVLTHENGTSIEYYAEGVELVPPSTTVLLEYVEMASEEMSDTGFTLNLVGGSSDGEYVEIIVPESTSRPLEGDTTSVSWDFENLDDLDQIEFQVKQHDEEGPEKPDQGSSYLLPAVGAIVVIGAAALFLMKKN